MRACRKGGAIDMERDYYGIEDKDNSRDDDHRPQISFYQDSCLHLPTSSSLLTPNNTNPLSQ